MKVIELLHKRLPVYVYLPKILVYYSGENLNVWKNRKWVTLSTNDIHKYWEYLFMRGEVIYPVPNYEELVEVKKELEVSLQYVLKPYNPVCLGNMIQLLPYITIPDFPSVKRIEEEISRLSEAPDDYEGY